MEKYEISLWEDFPCKERVIEGNILYLPVTYYLVNRTRRTTIKLWDDIIILPYLDMNKLPSEFLEPQPNIYIVDRGEKTPYFDKLQAAIPGLQFGGMWRFFPNGLNFDPTFFTSYFPNYHYTDEYEYDPLGNYFVNENIPAIENKINGVFLTYGQIELNTLWGGRTVDIYPSKEYFERNKIATARVPDPYLFLNSQSSEKFICYTEVDEQDGTILESSRFFINHSNNNNLIISSAVRSINYDFSGYWTDGIKSFFTGFQPYKFEKFMDEKKLCVIGSDTMTSQIRAIDPKLTNNINGTNTFTFKMYKTYIDDITGEKQTNPFLNLLINERKIKVFWKEQWYDLVVKNIVENSLDNSIVYTCQDLFISELSKNGYNLEFTSDLQNNTGTIDELTEKVLKGSGWSFDSENTDKVWQQAEDAVYEIVTSDIIEDVDKLPEKNENDQIDIPANSTILVFKTYIDQIVNDFKKNYEDVEDPINYEIEFCYNLNGYTRKENSIVVQQEDCFVKKFDVIASWTEDVDVGSLTFNINGNKIFIIDNLNKISTNYRAVRYVDTHKSVYDSDLDRYVNIYNDGDVYGYSNSEFTDPMQVINLIVNPSQFKDTTGWSGDGIDGIQIYPKLSQMVTPTDVKSYLRLGQTTGTATLIENSLFQANQGYFKPSQSDIRRGDVGGIKNGDKYIFRVKVHGGGYKGHYISGVETVTGKTVDVLCNATNMPSAGQTYGSEAGYLSTWGGAMTNVPHLFRVEAHHAMDEIEYGKYEITQEPLHIYQKIYVKKRPGGPYISQQLRRDYSGTVQGWSYIYITSAANFAAYFCDNEMTKNDSVLVQDYALQIVNLDRNSFPETVNLDIQTQVYADFKVSPSYEDGYINFKNAIEQGASTSLIFEQVQIVKDSEGEIISSDKYNNNPLTFIIDMQYLMGVAPTNSRIINNKTIATYKDNDTGKEILIVDRHNNLTSVENNNNNDNENDQIELQSEITTVSLRGLNDGTNNSSGNSGINEIEILNDFVINNDGDDITISKGDIIDITNMNVFSGSPLEAGINLSYNNETLNANFYILYYPEYITLFLPKNENNNTTLIPCIRCKRATPLNGEVFIKIGPLADLMYLDSNYSVIFNFNSVFYFPISQLDNESILSKNYQDVNNKGTATLIFQQDYGSRRVAYRKQFNYYFSSEAQVFYLYDTIPHAWDETEYGYLSVQPVEIQPQFAQYCTYIGEYVGPDIDSSGYVRQGMLNGVEWYNNDPTSIDNTNSMPIVPDSDDYLPLNAYSNFTEGVGLIPVVIKDGRNILAISQFFYDIDTQYNVCEATFFESVPANKISELKFQLEKQISDSIYIEDIQFFKCVEDEYGNMILPGQYGKQSIQHTIYRYYEPNQDVPADQIEFLYQGEDPRSDIYTPVIIYEKMASIEAKNSNRFNILQEIAERFNRWPRFIIEHDANGKIIVINGEQQKKIAFVEQTGVDLGWCFEYGIDLKNVRRTIASNDIVTKTIVVPNDNEFGLNGFCAIARSKLNYPKENFILNFDYYISQGLLDQEQVIRDLYYTSNDDLIKQYVGYYYYLNKYNSQYDQASELLQTRQMDMTKWLAQLTVLEAQKSATEQQITSIRSDMIMLANIDGNIDIDIAWPEAYRYITGHTGNAKIQALLEQYTLTVSDLQRLEKQIADLTTEIDNLQFIIDGYVEDQKTLIDLLNAKHQEFFKKYSRYVQEGTWQDNNYVNDDEYYLDALEVAHESAFPRLQYEINVMRVSELEEYSSKVFYVGDVCHIIDRDFFGYCADGITPYRLQIVISEVTSNFEQPDKDVIKVQNFLTQFDDLFQRITATTQTLQYRQGSFERAAAIISHDNTLSFEALQSTFDYNEDWVLNASNQQVTWDSTGITITDDRNAALKLRLMAGGMFLTNDGGSTWKNAIRGDGISANLLTAGRINTSEIYLYDGNNPLFRWDSQGITAYARKYSEVNNEYTEIKTGFDRFIRFDQFGLYGYDGSEDFTPLYEDMIWDNSKTKFGLTWKGFFLRGGNNGNTKLQIEDTGSDIVFSISKKTGDNLHNRTMTINTDKIQFRNDYSDMVTIGDLGEGKYGLQIKNAFGSNILTVSSDETSTIGGWIITPDAITSQSAEGKSIVLSADGEISAGNGKFVVNRQGQVTCKDIRITENATLNLGPNKFIVDASGNVTCKSITITDDSSLDIGGVNINKNKTDTITIGNYAVIKRKLGQTTVDGIPYDTEGFKISNFNGNHYGRVEADEFYIIITDAGVRLQANQASLAVYDNTLYGNTKYGITIQGDVTVNGSITATGNITDNYQQ